MITAKIASPGLDQSRTIGRYLRGKYRDNFRLIGQLLPGESTPRTHGPFDEIVRIVQFDLDDVIPTGGRSTAARLEDNDVSLGGATLTRAALRFFDKPWSLALAAEAGVPVPTTWQDAPHKREFPIFYKSATEGGGIRGLARTFDELPDIDGLIYQEYITSAGTYGVGFLAQSGKILTANLHFEAESYPQLGGSAVLIEQFADERLLRHAKAILHHSKFDGWGLIEFKYCPNRDDFVFMELNAKFWASCEFAFRNQPDFARILFDAGPIEAPCERMVFMHRALQRGWRFVSRSLPRMITGADLSWGGSDWQAPLAKLVLPSIVLGQLRNFKAK